MEHVSSCWRERRQVAAGSGERELSAVQAGERAFHHHMNTASTQPAHLHVEAQVRPTEQVLPPSPGDFLLTDCSAGSPETIAVSLSHTHTDIFTHTYMWVCGDVCWVLQHPVC